MMVQDSPMIEVSIPSLEREVDESGKLRKLFRVEILFNGRKHFVLRRHSEFQTLHRKDIIYQYEEVPQVLLDFLHVKHFHSGNKISSLEYVPAPSPQPATHIRSFDDSDPQGYGCQLQHQRVVGFCRDPYLLESPSDLPDIVKDGVLQGLYPRDIRVSFTACTKPSLPDRPSLAPGPAHTFKAPAIPSI
ncbi:unnamed protein product [Coregonus sp. 'balchen']|nr:unnamed protein product [Coregonus sp. 'balchen']